MLRSPPALQLSASLLCAAFFNLLVMATAAAQDPQQIGTTPLPPEYRIQRDGSVTLRLCFNWSCASRQELKFSKSEMAHVKEQMAICSGDGARDRLQQIRIAIWQMELLAQKHQPLLANDQSTNNHDQDQVGRMDCIDNTSNTTTYLKILQQLGWLPGWSIEEPVVRDRFSFDVHWTATVIDTRVAQDEREPWTIDSWYRGNGNLPFVMPVQQWLDGEMAWVAPFDQLNSYPQYTNQLCVQ